MVWKYEKANWTQMEFELSEYQWGWAIDTCPDLAAAEFQSVLIDCIEKHVPSEVVQIRSGTHPWFNDVCVEAVRQKHLAWGSTRQLEASERCSKTLSIQYLAYIETTKTK